MTGRSPNPQLRPKNKRVIREDPASVADEACDGLANQSESRRQKPMLLPMASDDEDYFEEEDEEISIEESARADDDENAAVDDYFEKR